MRRLGWLAFCALLGCGQAVEPPVVQYGVRDGKEPVVRVHLRSLGEGWERLPVAGKEGLVVEGDGRSTSSSRPIALGAVEGDRIRVGNRRVRRLVLKPLGGIVTVDGHSYAGHLVWEKGKLVNHVTMENYVLGVLRGELPLRKVPKEAAAAQAIAVRSYTMHYLAQDRTVFDVDDTTLYQRYVGVKYAPDDRALRAGVRATTGLYLAHRGQPLKAYYHSTCGGHTTDVPTGLSREPVAPMAGVRCDHCRHSKYWRWKADVPAARVLRAAALEGPLESVEVVERGAGERARTLRVRTASGEKTLRANEARLRIGPSALRSTLIRSIAPGDNGAVHVEGGGWGHGVGLCQMGAIGLARKGKTGRAIVAYYYPGARLDRAY